VLAADDGAVLSSVAVLVSEGKYVAGGGGGGTTMLLCGCCCGVPCRCCCCCGAVGVEVAVARNRRCGPEPERSGGGVRCCTGGVLLFRFPGGCVCISAVRGGVSNGGVAAAAALLKETTGPGAWMSAALLLCSGFKGVALLPRAGVCMINAQVPDERCELPDRLVSKITVSKGF
jgi:hypothetical protein